MSQEQNTERAPWTPHSFKHALSPPDSCDVRCSRSSISALLLCLIPMCVLLYIPGNHSAYCACWVWPPASRMPYSTSASALAPCCSTRLNLARVWGRAAASSAVLAGGGGGCMQALTTLGMSMSGMLSKRVLGLLPCPAALCCWKLRRHRGASSGRLLACRLLGVTGCLGWAWLLCRRCWCWWRLGLGLGWAGCTLGFCHTCSSLLLCSGQLLLLRFSDSRHHSCSSCRSQLSCMLLDCLLLCCWVGGELLGLTVRSLGSSTWLWCSTWLHSRGLS